MHDEGCSMAADKGPVLCFWPSKVRYHGKLAMSFNSA